MDLRTFLLYSAAWALVALTPGPAVLCAMAQATRHGFRPSLAGISGIQTGNLLFFISIALGLATLLSTATAAFEVLRAMGAVYLLYLGVRLIVGPPPERTGEGAGPDRSPAGLYLQGLLIQITNPKALLFITAFLPQFITPHRPIAWQLVLLGAATVVIDTGVLAAYASLAGRGVHFLRGRTLVRWLERVFGAALIFFGVRLWLARR